MNDELDGLAQYARYESTMIPDKVCALIEAECDAIKAMLVAGWVAIAAEAARKAKEKDDE